MSGTREHDGRYEACTADTAAYVLGALTEEEHRDFLVHLRACAACSEEVADLQVVADALPASVPQVSAPPQLRARVLASIGAPGAVAQGASGTQARPPRARLSGRGRAPSGFLARRPRLALGGLVGAVALALALALLAITGGGGGGSSHARVIRAEARAPGARASLRVNASRAELDLSGMPQTSSQRVYEVWVERGGQPQPTDALFTVSRAGDATVAVPGGVAGATMVLVTSEPRGGSRAPTTAPIIVANL